jgi:meso-butanediol dehydrogenase/(S,S)-butanediol dehydrogenase/diacetyl reductase
VSRLRDKVAIVTGGSRGIGRGIVERFLEEGARIVATARRAPSKALPGERNLHFVTADVSRAEDAARLVATAVERFGGLDILVNNAGIQLQKPLEETTDADWDR